MKYDFDTLHNRKNTNSYKWDQTKKLYGHDDMLPLWVADMDFMGPPEIREALIRRAELGIYGYSIKNEDYTQSIISWFNQRHQWNIDASWISDSPGIVTTMSLAVQLFTEPGDSVILQAPVYYPFYDVIKMNGREVTNNPLVIRNGRYEMDFEQLEQIMQTGVKLMLFCNPQNPGGRVWEYEELKQLSELCKKYNVIVVSDEIHCDLIFPGHKHIPFASISEETASFTITALAATKTFNLPGLQTSFYVTSNREIKRKMDHQIKALSIHMMSYFGQDAVIAAYEFGAPWLDQMLAYVKDNIDYSLEYLSLHLPKVKAMKPEGTYLLWVDCRELGLSVSELKSLMYDKAKVVFNEGSIFGVEGAGYVRINHACPRSILVEALERFCQAANEL